MTGVRHDQTKNRSSLHDLETQISGVIKIHPLLRWDKARVEEYRRRYELPEHPLYQAGYLSRVRSLYRAGFRHGLCSGWALDGNGEKRMWVAFGVRRYLYFDLQIGSLIEEGESDD